MKKILKENRILFVLFIILIVCFVAICAVTVSYFVGSHKSVYGERLENKVEVTKDIENDYLSFFNDDELITDAKLRVSIRTIYIKITGSEKATLDLLKDKATKSIEKLPEDVLAYYDLNFTLEKDKNGSEEGFTIMGAKNSNSEFVSWNNNIAVEEE